MFVENPFSKSGRGFLLASPARASLDAWVEHVGAIHFEPTNFYESDFALAFSAAKSLTPYENLSRSHTLRGSLQSARPKNSSLVPIHSARLGQPLVESR